MKLLNLWLLVLLTVIVSIITTVEYGVVGASAWFLVLVTGYIYKREYDKEIAKKVMDKIASEVAEGLKDAKSVKVFK